MCVCVISKAFLMFGAIFSYYLKSKKVRQRNDREETENREKHESLKKRFKKVVRNEGKKKEEKRK